MSKKIPRSGNLLYPSLVHPDLKKVGRELNVLRSLLSNEIDVQYWLLIESLDTTSIFFHVLFIEHDATIKYGLRLEIVLK